MAAGDLIAAEVAFACAISEDRKHGSVVAAGRAKSGRVLVDLAPFYDHPRLLVARMGVLYARHDPVVVVVNPKSQSGTLITPLAEAGIVVKAPSAEDVATAHGSFLDLVNDGGLEHLDQGPLTAAVRAGQQRPLSGAQAWDPKVAVDQSPLVAATLAVWGFLEWERLCSPGAWVVLGGAGVEQAGLGDVRWRDEFEFALDAAVVPVAGPPDFAALPGGAEVAEPLALVPVEVSAWGFEFAPDDGVAADDDEVGESGVGAAGVWAVVHA